MDFDSMLDEQSVLEKMMKNKPGNDQAPMDEKADEKNVASPELMAKLDEVKAMAMKEGVDLEDLLDGGADEEEEGESSDDESSEDEGMDENAPPADDASGKKKLLIIAALKAKKAKGE